MSWACRKPLSHATKSYRVNRPLNGRASGIDIVLGTEVFLELARRTKVLFVLAIEKSNIEADLIKIELPGSEIDFVRTQIRDRGDDLSDANRKQGRHVQHII